MRAFFRIPLLAVLIASLSGSFFSSCNKADKAQLEKIDSLEVWLKEAKNAMNLDTGAIKKRCSEMKQNMGTIRLYYKGGYTEDLARDMDLYRGITKIYERFLDAYPVIHAELTELQQQVRNLRYSARKAEFNDSQFLVHYNREKTDILSNAENIRVYVHPVYESEPFYKKINPRVEAMVREAEKEKAKEQAN